MSLNSRWALTGLLLISISCRGASPEAVTPAEQAPVIPHDLALRQCVELALEHNPDIRRASQQFLTAEGRVIQLHAILYPTVSAQALSTPLTFYVQINQVFYSAATFPQLRLARLSEQAVFINYRQTITDVVFQVRQAFTAALGARDQNALQQDYTEREAGSATKAQQLFDAGQAHRSDVLAIQVKVNLARTEAANLGLQNTRAIIALQNLLGVVLPKSVHLVGDLDRDTAPEKLDAAQLSAQALRDRQDLPLLQTAKLMADEEIIISQKDLYPTVGFSSNSAIQPPAIGPTSFDLERNDTEPATQRIAGNSQVPLSLYLTWRVFDGGSLRGQKMSAEAGIATQEIAIRQLQQSIPAEVNSVVASILLQRETLQILGEETSSKEMRESARLDLDAGRVRQLDVANLEDSILTREQLRLQAQVQLNLAAAALDHALGHGLETTQVATRQPSDSSPR